MDSSQCDFETDLATPVALIIIISFRRPKSSESRLHAKLTFRVGDLNGVSTNSISILLESDNDRLSLACHGTMAAVIFETAPDHV